MIYVALVFINDNEVRLSTVQASSLDNARNIVECEYKKALSPENSTRIEIYKAECVSSNFEELSVTLL